MATYIKEQVGDLDVINTYKKLMEVGLGEDSAYIRAKETVTSLVDNTDLSSREKADIIAKTVSTLASNITSHSLQAAIDITKENRDAPYVLTKLKEDTLAVKVSTENAIKEGRILDLKEKGENIALESSKLQAAISVSNAKIDNGVDIQLPAEWGINMQYHDSGVKYTTMNQTKADTYRSWATAYRNGGQLSITGDYTNPTFLETKTDYSGLIDSQMKVSLRNVQSFEDNKRQHAANSSAAMLGTMISSSAFSKESAYTPFLDKWSESINYLNGGSGATSSPGAIVIKTTSDDVTRDTDQTVSGTFDNVTLGTTVFITVVDDATDNIQDSATVLVDGSDWTSTLDLSGSAAITITAKGKDSTGATRRDILKLN